MCTTFNSKNFQERLKCVIIIAWMDVPPLPQNHNNSASRKIMVHIVRTHNLHPRPVLSWLMLMFSFILGSTINISWFSCEKKEKIKNIKIIVLNTFAEYFIKQKNRKTEKDAWTPVQSKDEQIRLGGIIIRRNHTTTTRPWHTTLCLIVFAQYREVSSN